MKKMIAMAGAVLLLWGGRGLAQDADTLDTVFKEMIGMVKEATQVLTTIKDKDTAQTATPKLKKLGEKAQQLQQKMQKLGRPTQQQQQEVFKKYGKEFQEAQVNYKKEEERVKKIPGGKEALKALEPTKNSGGTAKDKKEGE